MGFTPVFAVWVYAVGVWASWNISGVYHRQTALHRTGGGYHLREFGLVPTNVIAALRGVSAC